MSCDNIPGNGHVTENAVAGLAELADPELARWIRANVAFPNSMVDRITPATTDRERAILRDKCGLEDNWPVFCEEFRQWVVEDKFPAGRPALETVGVTFTSDVAPYELMKIRILNGGHAAIAYPAGLLDIHFVHEAMADEQIRAFLEKLTKREIQPVVPPPPNTRSRRLSRTDRAPLRQSEDRRHHPAPLLRRLEPAAEVHSSLRRRSAESRRVRPGSGARVGSLVPLLLRRNRERQADRAERPELGAACKRRRSRRAAIRWRSSNCATSSAIWRAIRTMSARFPMRSRRSGRAACDRLWPTICRTSLEPEGSDPRARPWTGDRGDATMKLKDKVALVTGGARGIGAAIAERYVAEGARVAIADISLAHAEETAARHGDKAFAVALDVTKTASIEAAVENVVQRWGGVDILVNNAGDLRHGADRRGDRGELRQGLRRQRQRPLLHPSGGRQAHDCARAGRQDHQHGLAGRPPRRSAGVDLLRLQGRRHQPDPIGGAGPHQAPHQRQWHCARRRRHADVGRSRRPVRQIRASPASARRNAWSARRCRSAAWDCRTTTSAPLCSLPRPTAITSSRRRSTSTAATG